MKKNVYEIEKNVEKLLRGNSTGFLTNVTNFEVLSHLRSKDVHIFKPFEEAEKVILYKNNYPMVRLFRINCYKDDSLQHSSIMGSLFGLNITSEMFGDIVKYKDNFYVYLLDDICELVLDNFRMVGNINISLEEVDSNYLSDFKREYEKITLIVSSLRVDTIASKLIGCSRDIIVEKIRNQEILINDKPATKISNLIDINDIFSIRKYGKYKFRDIIGKTKKDNYIIEIDKYI